VQSAWNVHVKTAPHPDFSVGQDAGQLGAKFMWGCFMGYREGVVRVSLKFLRYRRYFVVATKDHRQY
jgi:hypothetical protein